MKKINKEELRKKIWEYFWKQKLFEIGTTIGIIFILIILPYIIGYSSCKINQDFTQDWASIDGENGWHPICYSGFLTTWGIGWMIIIMLSLVIIIICFSILIICKWIYNNWKKAEKKAREELKNEK